MHLRLWFALLSALAITLLWDMPILLPIKLLVVYVHEASHGVAALLSGAYLEKINLNMNEWGETLVRNLDTQSSFIFTVSAGYLGTISFGVLLLAKGLKAKFERITLILFSLALLYSGFLFTDIGSLSFFVAFGWSGFIFATAFLPIKYVRLVSILLGVFFIWYCFFDLFDFAGNIENTDAGILARYLLDQDNSVLFKFTEFQVATGLSIIWSLFIVFIVAITLTRTIKYTDPLDSPPVQMDDLSNLQPINPMDQTIPANQIVDGQTFTNKNEEFSIDERLIHPDMTPSQ